MAKRLARFADAEDVVLALLEQLTYEGRPVRAVTSAPTKFQPPLVIVRRLGGEDDGITDYPRIQVTTIGYDRHSSVEIAEEIRQILLASNRTQVVLRDGRTALIDHVLTSTPAEEVDELNQDFRRTVALFDISMRRPR